MEDADVLLYGQEYYKCLVATGFDPSRMNFELKMSLSDLQVTITQANLIKDERLRQQSIEEFARQQRATQQAEEAREQQERAQADEEAQRQAEDAQQGAEAQAEADAAARSQRETEETDGGFEVVDSSDIVLAPERYIGKKITIRNLRCYFAGDADYRCSSNSEALGIFGKLVTPIAAESFVRTKCNRITVVMASETCVATARIAPSDIRTVHDSDGRERTVVEAYNLTLLKGSL